MSALPIHRVQIREARFEDYEGIVALEAAHALASKPFDEWRRLWIGNPLYERLDRRWPIGWVLKDGARVVGCSCNIPLPYVFRNRELVVASGRGWVVEDQYRGYAPLLADEYFNQNNVDLFLNNTVNDKAANVFSTFGSLRIPMGDWACAAFAITRHRGFAESALRIKAIAQPRLLSYAVGAVLMARDRFRGKSIPRARMATTFARRFDERFDAFWTRLKDSTDALLAVRSSDVLTWHFGPSLASGNLWILTCESAGMLQAYAVFQRRDEPRFGLKRMRMVDFQACERHDEFCTTLVARALEECRKQGIHVLERVGCDLTNTRAFDAVAQHRRRLPSWSFFYSAPKPDLAQDLESAAAWAPSSYDGDASL